jgi:hypothetical protein
MDEPRRRTHFLPRTRDGRIAVVAFVTLFSLAMPPVTHALFNRAEPWILGLPFIFAVLLAVYVVSIGVLIWAFRRGV